MQPFASNQASPFYAVRLLVGVVSWRLGKRLRNDSHVSSFPQARCLGFGLTCQMTDDTDHGQTGTLRVVAIILHQLEFLALVRTVVYLFGGACRAGEKA